MRKSITPSVYYAVKRVSKDNPTMTHKKIADALYIYSGGAIVVRRSSVGNILRSRSWKSFVEAHQPSEAPKEQVKKPLSNGIKVTDSGSVIKIPEWSQPRKLSLLQRTWRAVLSLIGGR